MQDADFEFIEEMIKQLDETIRNLSREQTHIRNKLDPARIDELHAYWRNELDDAEHKELTVTMDHWDKMLIFTWNRLHRAHQTRAMAGKALMQHKKIRQTKDD